MKRFILAIAITGALVAPLAAPAQQEEIEQLLLDLQKLAYLKNILSDLKKGYEIVFAGYSTIKSISEGSFNLHRQFLDALLQVSPAVQHYKRIADIISSQLELVKQYRAALQAVTLSGLFTADELDYVTSVGKNLFDRSAKNLESLAMVVTQNKLCMSDAERLSAIDDIYSEATSELGFLKKFSSDVKLLGLGRLRQAAGLSSVSSLYGIHH